MTDKKISELTSITGADVSDANDVLPIVDTSVATTKKITRAELFKSVSSVDINGGTIDGTVIGGSTPAAISGTTGTFSGNLTVDTNTLYVDSTNNRVGIGTSSPTDKLNISSGSNQIGLDTGNQATYGTLDLGHFTNGAFIGTQAGTNAASNVLRFGTSGTERMRLNSDGSVYWKPDGTTQAMTLDASGNLLVGTTIANGTLSLANNGTSYTAYLTGNSSNGYNLLLRAATTPAVAIRFLSYSGTDVGSIDTTATATSYTTSSDYRLKEDVQPMVGASERVLSLNPVNFAWKADGTRVDGFLAHEAQAVAPYAVTGEKDGEEMQSIDHSKLVPLLTAALQEALGRIETLEAEVAALET